MPVYSTRFKSSRQSGVVVAHHEAADLPRAEASARAWCNAEPGRMYISTSAWISFTDDNLAAPDAIEQGEQPAEQRRGPGRPRKDAATFPA